jgi:ATP adenylyltransferase
MSATLTVDISNARTDEQRRIMQQIIDDGVCPFCPEYLQKYHGPKVLKQGKYWIVTANSWPYNHTRVHLLLISIPHWETFAEITPEAAAEYFELVAGLVDEYKVKGGGLAMRFGDTNYSAGTVKHLHAQFIVPDIESPEFEPVRVKLGKKQET